MTTSADDITFFSTHTGPAAHKLECDSYMYKSMAITRQSANLNSVSFIGFCELQVEADS